MSLVIRLVAFLLLLKNLLFLIFVEDDDYMRKSYYWGGNIKLGTMHGSFQLGQQYYYCS